MEYTYADVIIDPNDPRVEIGAYYYFGNNPTCLLKDISQLSAHEGRLTIVDIGKDICSFPFIADTQQPFVCIIRKKEPSYEERQSEWVKTNDIKVGDKVRIIREFYDYEDSFSYIFHFPEMKRLIGKICEISSLWTNGIKVFNEDKSSTWIWPFFCLEKVEEPEFKVGDFVKTNNGYLGVIKEVNHLGSHIVRNNNLISVEYNEKEIEHIKAHIEPFDFNDPEVRRRLTGETIIHNCFDGDDEFKEIMIVGFMNKGDEDRDCWSSNGYTEGTIAMTIDGFFHADELLKECTFLDGTPCGIVVEDK